MYYNTPLGIVHRLVEGKSPVSHVFWREFYNYGPPPLIALLPSAINAFIAGQDPTVNPEEWHVGSTPAQSLVALPTTESRPVGNPCSKFVIFSKAVDRVFSPLHRCVQDCGGGAGRLPVEKKQKARKDNSPNYNVSWNGHNVAAVSQSCWI